MSWIRTRIECLLAEGRRRSRWTAAAAVLAALVVVGVVAALSQGATAQTTGTANPSKGKLTSATFSVSRNGHVERLGQNESVAAGTRVQFALTFDFGSNTFSSGDSTVTYTLPEGLVADTVESGEIKGDSSHPDQADKVLGTYSIKDGVVTMTFNEDQVSGLSSARASPRPSPSGLRRRTALSRTRETSSFPERARWWSIPPNHS